MVPRSVAEDRLGVPHIRIGPRDEGWAQDALLSNDPHTATRDLLSIAQAAEAIGLTWSTLRTYRKAGKFAAPDAVLCPKPRYGWLYGTVAAWKIEHPTRIGRPQGSSSMIARARADATVYLTAGDVAQQLGITRSRVLRLQRAQLFPCHDALIGERKVWLPRTIEALDRSLLLSGATVSVTPSLAGPVRRYVTTSELARTLRVSDVTVRNSLGKGRLPLADAVAGTLLGWSDVEAVVTAWECL